MAPSVVRWNAGDGRKRQNRCPYRTERDRCGIGDERQSGSIERGESQPDEQGGADGHRRAKTRRSLDERAKGKRHQQRLNAAIARQPTDRGLDDFKLAGVNGQVIKKDRVQNDPADRQEAVGRTVKRRWRPRSEPASRRRWWKWRAPTAGRRARPGGRAIRADRAPRGAGRSETQPRPCSTRRWPSGS